MNSLQQRYRVMVTLNLILLCTIVGLLTMGLFLSVPDKIEAHEFVLVGSDGTPIGRWYEKLLEVENDMQIAFPSLELWTDSNRTYITNSQVKSNEFNLATITDSILGKWKLLGNSSENNFRPVFTMNDLTSDSFVSTNGIRLNTSKLIVDRIETNDISAYEQIDSIFWKHDYKSSNHCGIRLLTIGKKGIIDLSSQNNINSSTRIQANFIRNTKEGRLTPLLINEDN